MSDKLKEMTFAELLGKFDAEVHEAIHNTINDTGATELVLAENLMMDSSSFGDRSCMMAGPTCTYKTHEDCEGKWLKDLPSQRQYFTAWCKV